MSIQYVRDLNVRRGENCGSYRKERVTIVILGEKCNSLSIVKYEFCMEMEIEGTYFQEKWWIIFVYASTEDNIRRRQWEMLK